MIKQEKTDDSEFHAVDSNERASIEYVRFC